ncbi:MAG: ArgE/DapE family deacylase [Chloroflexi bacterium]|nr:ArgE/DapE family deacylase [Chloroflexota bacterium]
MKEKIEKLLGDLIAIDSTNPEIVPSAEGEAEIAAFVANWLEEAGLEVHLHESAPNRPNVVAIARGRGGGKSLLLNGHMDTVGAGEMIKPHQPEIKNGRLFGLGALDMKGGLAACMLAAAQAKKLQLRGDVILTAVVDEEYAGKGTMTVAELYHADGAIIAEPTQCQLIVAHKGFVWLDIETIGVAAHGSRPDLGVDAIMKMGSVLSGLEELQNSMQTRQPHPRLGHPSLHTSTIQGGREPSTYPERCTLSIERRILPGENPETVRAEVEEIIEKRRQIDPQFNAIIRTGLYRTPLETPEDAAIVQAVKAAGSRVLNYSLELSGAPYWTDAATLWQAGIPSVIFGPSGEGIHAAEEWVELESVADCLEIFIETAQRFCA